MSRSTHNPEPPLQTDHEVVHDAGPDLASEDRRPGEKPDLSRIAGMPLWYYAAIFVTLLVAALTGNIPDTMLAGFAVTLVLGGLLIWIGNAVPFLRDFGLPTILCTFIPAILIYLHWMPSNVTEVVKNFTDGYGFLDFFVIAVITGSILGMPRKLLLTAGPRFIVPVVGTLVTTYLLVGAVGAATGFGFVRAILFVAAPIMAGGLGVGAVPMSKMYAQELGTTSEAFMGQLMAAVVIANVICILIAGLYHGLGRRSVQLFAGFDGHGRLLRIEGRDEDLVPPRKITRASFLSMGQGLMIAGTLIVLGTMLGHYLDFLHPYAWTILFAAAVKILGLFPKELEDAAAEWGDYISTIFVPALLVGVSITYISIKDVLAALSHPSFLVLTVICVIVAALSAGALGWLVKFHFVEASICPGLVMADTGGSGDVSVLSAADRLHLMPFAALTNRIGGALVLFLTSLLVPLLS